MNFLHVRIHSLYMRFHYKKEHKQMLSRKNSVEGFAEFYLGDTKSSAPYLPKTICQPRRGGESVILGFSESNTFPLSLSLL